MAEPHSVRFEDKSAELSGSMPSEKLIGPHRAVCCMVTRSAAIRTRFRTAPTLKVCAAQQRFRPGELARLVLEVPHGSGGLTSRDYAQSMEASEILTPRTLGRRSCCHAGHTPSTGRPPIWGNGIHTSPGPLAGRE